MPKLWYTNSRGDVLSLTSGSVRAISVNGLSPEVAINVSQISGYDGGTFISSQIPMRSILIMVGLMGDFEESKRLVYNAFRPKEIGAFSFRHDDGKISEIDCFVEKLPYELTQSPREMQISLTCPDPYFHDSISVPTVMATLTPNWEYPLKIEGDAGIELSKIDPSLIAKVTNTGQLPTGCVFEIRALGNLENPKLQDINTFKFIGAELSLAAGDVLLIDTRLGKKSLTKISGKVKKDVFNCLMEDSVFLQLAVGDNEFRRFADGNEDNMEVICRHENLSAGV